MLPSGLQYCGQSPHCQSFSPVFFPAPAALTDGLISYWDLADGAGLTALDAHGANDGALVNTPTWTTAAIGPALDFDLANQEIVDCGSPTDLQLDTSPLTLSQWMVAKSDYTTTQYLFSCGASSSAAKWMIRFGTVDNKFTFIQGNTAVLTTTASVSTNDPVHVVLVRDGSPGDWDVTFYINGALDSTAATAATPTTGGLWVSDNGGDDWQCLSHTLPPIYCVRFGE